MASRFDRYLAQLERLTAGIEPIVNVIDPHEPLLKPIATLTYADLPETGCLTAVTYGLSLAHHPDWLAGRPELSITVRPAEPAWVLRVGRMVDVLRGRCSFRHGMAIGGPPEPGFGMSSYVIAGPGFLYRNDFLPLDVGPSDSDERDIINLAGCYPIHPSERDFIYSKSFHAFWSLAWARFDTARPPSRTVSS